MRFPTVLQRALAVGLVIFGVASGAGRTQQMGQPQMPGTPGTQQAPGGKQGLPSTSDPFGEDSKSKGDDMPTHPMSDKQVKWRNEERQQRLVSDTNKLLTLATQLHEDVAKTDKNILSLDVVRRADEIEKLAHSVKERMKD